MELKKLIFAFRGIGIRNILRTIQYSFRRDNAEKKYSPHSISSSEVSPGEFRNIKPIFSGTKIEFEHASVEAQFLSPNLLKISWEPGEPPLPFTIDKFDWENQHPILRYREAVCTLSTDQMMLKIHKGGAIEFQDHLNNTLRIDQPPKRRGVFWQLRSQLRTEEHIYGLGERASSLNLRPGNYSCWNRDVGGNYSVGVDPLYIGTPIYVSLSNVGCYLVYFENSYKSSFTFDDQASIIFNGGILRYYIGFGSLSSIFQQFSELIGKPYLPPQWVLGYHQSRWGYRSEEEIRKVVDGFKEHDLPLSAIHLDIDYMDGYRVFTINQDRFSDMKGLTTELDEKGVKLVASINPAVKKDLKYKVFINGMDKNAFCKSLDGKPFIGISWPGWSMFPDFINPDTREWWSEQYKVLINAGISGFWHDMNEPTSFTAWGDMCFPNNITHSLSGQQRQHAEVHNLYALLMNKAAYEGLRKYKPEKRPWIFSRAGWAGMQRYAWNWTGDIESSWEALAITIPSILGLSLSGHAFSGVDIGGFSGDPEAELYLRWLQLATFLPLFRTHSAIGNKHREPWVYGEPTTSIIRAFLKLRYKLMPYTYTTVWDTCQKGIPAVRPVFWEGPDDERLWDIKDEFLLGEALLIAPIIEKRARKRRIFLPSGNWYSLWDDQIFTGYSQFEHACILQNIPVFVKGGSILPMKEDANLVFHLYPNESGQTTNHVYSDKGDGYDAWRLDTFFSDHTPDSMTIAWEPKGDFPILYSQIKFVLHGKKLHKAKVDSENTPIQGNTFIAPVFHNLQLDFK